MFYLDTNEKKCKNLEGIWKTVVGYLSLQYTGFKFYFHLHIKYKQRSMIINSENEIPRERNSIVALTFFPFFFDLAIHQLSKGGICFRNQVERFSSNIGQLILVCYNRNKLRFPSPYIVRTLQSMQRSSCCRRAIKQIFHAFSCTYIELQVYLHTGSQRCSRL